MTVAAEIAKTSQRLEYILCVEGIGWPVDESESDFASGFAGDVFVTNDIDGTLATKLGCTIHYGLHLPRSISDRYDPRTNAYEHGNMIFTVQDTDGTLLGAIKPLYASGNKGTLNSAITYDDTTVVVATYEAAASSVVWVAGREAIKLGTKAGAGPWTYTSCTRGYLGTPRGKHDHHPTDSLDRFAWDSGTAVHDYCRYWHNRRVMFLAHVPGEAVTEVKRLYSGRLLGSKMTTQGKTWTLGTKFDLLGRANRMHFSPTGWTVGAEEWSLIPGRPYFSQPAEGGTGSATGFTITEANVRNFYRRITLAFDGAGDRTRYDRCALWFNYKYRNRVSGGTKGAPEPSDFTAPQADQDSSSRYIFGGLCKIGDQYLRGPFKADDASYDANTIDFQAINYSTGSARLAPFDKGTPVRFLLDTYAPGKLNSWFALNNEVTRNPIDVLLMFLTSCNGEYFIGDTAAGSTSTVINFAPASFVADTWNGYALHAIEGTNEGEARVISDGGTAQLTVDRAYTGAPAASKEYQVRNTIYDVLPFGWGMGIPNWMIDLDSFEDARDLYLADAELGRFAIGETEYFDLWDLLQKNICQPYGILVRLSRSTGKLECKYVGETIADDGLFDTFTTVTAQHILSIGEIDYAPRPPVTGVGLQIRARQNVAIRPVLDTVQYMGQQVEVATNDHHVDTINSVEIGGQAEVVNITCEELDSAFDDNSTERLKVSALFDDIDSMSDLIPQMTGRFRRCSIPRPEVDVHLDLQYVIGTKLTQAGDLLSITDTTKHNPVNPYTASLGWSTLIARVLSTEVVLSESQPGLRCRIQLLNANTLAKIAPAATVTAKGNDAGGDYFQCNLTDFVINHSDTDLDEFAVDDLIELRNADGSFVEAEVIKTIDTGTGKVYVDGAIASAITAGDYITFSAWTTATNTSNMNTFSAYADASETIDTDAAREYM